MIRLGIAIINPEPKINEKAYISGINAMASIASKTSVWNMRYVISEITEIKANGSKT